MPENKTTPAPEAKKPDTQVKAPGASTEVKLPADAKAPQSRTVDDAPKEPPKVPPPPPTTPPPPLPKTLSKQPEDKGKASGPKTTVAEKPDEKGTSLPPKETVPTILKDSANKKTEEKRPNEKATATDPKPKAATEPKKMGNAVKGAPTTNPKKPQDKAADVDTKGQPVDIPKKGDPKAPIVVSGKDKVNIPIEPKPADKADAPKAKAEAAAGLMLQSGSTAQQAEGPKGIVITQVFDDRLTPPTDADLKKLPIPKEGEAFSMRLHPAYFFEFLEHPFSINRETKDYKDLRESIKENGIRDPVYCRPREKGGLEIISGHRRHDIGTQLNYPIPTIIVQADDDTARIAVVDGNLHRMDIPTSELARAAKMKMEALTRKAGRRSKMEQLTAPQKRSDQQVADDMGMSRNQVQRLVRIDSLVPELKQQVDDKKLPFNTAVELSYMNPEEQKKVVDFMAKEQVTPSMAQATALKEASRHAETLKKHTPSLAPAHAVDEKKIASIIRPKKEPELKVTLSADELRSYFPGKLPTVAEAKRAIFDGLDLRKKALERQAKKQDVKTPAR